jgi:ribosomal-protein-alanine N-acetyltransferase
LGVAIAQDVITDRVCRAIRMKIARMVYIDPKQHLWFTYWLLVVVDQQYGAGLVGFKGSPDGEGEVEIGYGISAAYRGQGYTTEAVRALIAWAFDAPNCVSIIAAEVDKANIASIRILDKVGMSLYKETNDNLYWHITRDVANIKKPLRQ